MRLFVFGRSSPEIVETLEVWWATWRPERLALLSKGGQGRGVAPVARRFAEAAGTPVQLFWSDQWALGEHALRAVVQQVLVVFRPTFAVAFRPTESDGRVAAMLDDAGVPCARVMRRRGKVSVVAPPERKVALQIPQE